MNKLTLDRSTCSVYWGGCNLQVTIGEFRIIDKLASKPGSYFSYRDIYDSLRGSLGFLAGDGVLGLRANVRSAIKRLRRKLEALDPTIGKFDVFKNYTAFGYCLKRDVIDVSRCPLCGQVVCTSRETVAVEPAPEPILLPLLS